MRFCDKQAVAEKPRHRLSSARADDAARLPTRRPGALMRKIPSLRSMHYFEAVARHGSFTGAARELGVSQSAVSHQIKLLERQLGASMILRSTRRVELTRRGHALFGAVTEALNILG